MIFKYLLVAVLVVPIAALGIFLLNNLLSCILENRKNEKK